MADQDIGDLQVRLQADVGRFNKALEASQRQIDQFAKKGEQNMNRLGNSVDRTTQKMTQMHSAVGRASRGLSDFAALSGNANVGLAAMALRINPVVAGFAALAGGATAVALGGDQMTKTFGRLNVILGSTGEATKAIEGLFQVAGEVGTSFDDATQAFTRFSLAARDIGASTEQVLGLTEAVQKLGAIGGGTMQEINAGSTQLAQALASGKLAGDELRSVLENMPLVARAIADGLGVGVGQLREMGAAGELVTDAVFGAILSQTNAINEEFDALPLTIDRAAGKAATAWRKFTSELDETLGLSSLLADALDGIAARLQYYAELVAGPAAEEQVKNLKAEIASLQATLDEGIIAGQDKRIQAEIDNLKMQLTTAERLVTAASMLERADFMDQGNANRAREAEAEAEVIKKTGEAFDDLMEKQQRSIELAKMSSDARAEQSAADAAEAKLRKQWAKDAVEADETLIAIVRETAIERVRAARATAEQEKVSEANRKRLEEEDDAYKKTLKSLKNATEETMRRVKALKDGDGAETALNVLLAQRAALIEGKLLDQEASLAETIALLADETNRRAQATAAAAAADQLASEQLDRTEQALEEQAEAAEKSREEWEKYEEELRELELEPVKNALEDVQKTLTDSINDALDGNIKSLKDWANEFVSIIKRLAANVLSQKIVIPVLSAGAGALGVNIGPQAPGAAPGGGGLLGGLFGGNGGIPNISGVGNLIGGLFGGGSAIAGTVTGGAASALGLASGATVTATQAAALAGPMAGLAGAPAVTGAGAGLAGAAGLASFALPAIGIAAAFALPAIMGGLFGKKNSSETIQAATAATASDPIFALQRDTRVSPFGFVGPGPNTKGTKAELDAELADFFQGLDQAVASLLSPDQVERIAAQIQGTAGITASGKNIDNEVAVVAADRLASMAETFEVTNAQFMAALESQVEFTEENIEKVIETGGKMLTIAARFDDGTLFKPAEVNAIVESWNLLSEQIVDARDQIVLMGLSLEEFNAMATEAQDTFKGDFLQGLALQAIGLNPAVVNSFAGIRESAQAAGALGLGDAADNDLAAIAAQQAAGIVGNLNRSHLEGLRGATDDEFILIAVDEALKMLAETGAETVNSLGDVRTQLEATIQTWQGVAENLRAFRESLLLDQGLTTLTPEQQLAEARQQLNQTFNQAMNGDADAANDLPRIASEFLDISRQFNTSTEAYQRDFNMVQGLLRKAEKHALKQVSAAQRQIEIQEEMVESLDQFGDDVFKLIQKIQSQYTGLVRSLRDTPINVTVNPGTDGGEATVVVDRNLDEITDTGNEFRVNRDNRQDRAGGGLVFGRKGFDTNQLWATAGEYVMQNKAVETFGVPAMESLNRGVVPPSIANPIRGGGGSMAGLIAENRALRGQVERLIGLAQAGIVVNQQGFDQVAGNQARMAEAAEDGMLIR